MDAWLRDVPPITRSWVILCVLTTVAVVRMLSSPFVAFKSGSPEISPILTDLVANRNGHTVAAVFQLQIDLYERPGNPFGWIPK